MNQRIIALARELSVCERKLSCLNYILSLWLELSIRYHEYTGRSTIEKQLSTNTQLVCNRTAAVFVGVGKEAAYYSTSNHYGFA